MKITHNLPQFEREETLFIVTGKQEAVFYKASHGSIEEIDAIKIPRPHYSDHEGEFKTRGHGDTFRSGSSNEYRDEDVIQEFIKEFKSKIKKISPDDYKKVYVMTPPQVKNTVIGAMPSHLRWKIKGIVDGNHSHAKPKEIIEKVASFETSTKPMTRTSKEAEKILHEADQASKVTTTKRIYPSKSRYY